MYDKIHNYVGSSYLYSCNSLWNGPWPPFSSFCHFFSLSHWNYLTKLHIGWYSRQWGAYVLLGTKDPSQTSLLLSSQTPFSSLLQDSFLITPPSTQVPTYIWSCHHFMNLSLFHTFMPFHAVPFVMPFTPFSSCDLSFKTQVKFYFLCLFLQTGFSFFIHTFYWHLPVLQIFKGTGLVLKFLICLVSDITWHIVNSHYLSSEYVS